MNIVPFTQVIINKSPSEIKPLLFTTTEPVQTWDKFVKRARRHAWISFPDKILNVISSNKNTSSNENYCDCHETTGHRTKDCIAPKKLKKEKKSSK